MNAPSSFEQAERNEVQRCYVLKKPGRDPKGEMLLKFLRETLGCKDVNSVRTCIRYDASDMTEGEFERVQKKTFAELPVDDVYCEEEFERETSEKTVLTPIESIPGQYNALEDWSVQSIMLEESANPKVRTAECIIIDGIVTDHQIAALESYLINKTESRKASKEKPKTLDEPLFEPADIKILDGFTVATDDELKGIAKEYKLAMTLEDMHEVQKYFANRKRRNPTVTELKITDTYWSDHCRHTTFTTGFSEVSIGGRKLDRKHEDLTPAECAVVDTFSQFMEDRKMVYQSEAENRPVTLMDLALISAKRLKLQGKLDNLDDSEENNAASIVVPITLEDGTIEEWLYMFKNETHNHPTEIEPFGGSATCVGGAIRDPLSGRSYVFMGMRLSGSANPHKPLFETRRGKLSQRRITIGAAEGYSSYGNQIGVPTQKVVELYHPGFEAKRMECGFVGGGAPKAQVHRERPAPGDVVILLGGRTGRDGIGGASGSSLSHTQTSTDTCGAEVQKGNAPEERKIQRLFRNPRVCRMIKRSNDFGAGGVSVAIGELSDGLSVDLDKVPLKYKGLDGTEIAISESQERMAVVIPREHMEEFLKLAEEENLEATHVGNVEEEDTLTMKWRGKTICDLDRDYLNGGWAKRETEVDMQVAASPLTFIKELPAELKDANGLAAMWTKNLSRLNVCSKRGLQNRFDSTVGANTIVGPFGGHDQCSPSEAVVAKFPIKGTTNAMASSMSLDPELSEKSPFHGALYAIVDAVARIVASGGDNKKVYLTLQNYFEKLGKDAKRWGKPLLAQLGAYLAQRKLDIAAIGGKDSMSGTYTDEETKERLDVPPTLAAFAVVDMDASEVVPSFVQQSKSTLVHLQVPVGDDGLPDWDIMKTMWARVSSLSKEKKILSNHAVHAGGVAAAVSEMCLGNRMGTSITHQADDNAEWFLPAYGSMVVEVPEAEDATTLFADLPHAVIGTTNVTGAISFSNNLVLNHLTLKHAYESPLDSVFPREPQDKGDGSTVIREPYTIREGRASDLKKIANPRVSVLALPGTNCEYETAEAFRMAGAKHVQTPIFVNLTREHIRETMKRFAKAIDNSQIIALPGGFSAGDQPDGSGKFGAAVLRNLRIADSINRLQDRGGLIIGICNGFQILVKSCLLPNGKIDVQNTSSTTLTHNTIGHFQSYNAMHKVMSVKSPFMNEFKSGELFDLPIAHGEGRLINVPEDVWENGQVPFQYVARDGTPRMHFPDNPNGSEQTIAALTDKTGRIFGMMAHPERSLPGLSRNIPTERKGLKIFQGGLSYFK